MFIARIYRRESPPSNDMINSSKYRLIYGGPVFTGNLKTFINTGLNQDVELKGFYQGKLRYGDIIEIVKPEYRSGFYLISKRGVIHTDQFRPPDIKNYDRSDMLYVMICEPLHTPYFALIQNKLEAMQHIVGGLIEPIFFEENDDVLAWCNEEFLLNGSVPNRYIGDIVVHGTCFISGDDPEKGICLSLTKERRDKYKKMFRGYFVPREPDIEK